jgi:hypothetical protein
MIAAGGTGLLLADAEGAETSDRAGTEDAADE